MKAILLNRALVCVIVLFLNLISIEVRAFDLSYWIDIDCTVDNSRGYWYHFRSKPVCKTPSNAMVKNCCLLCRYTYHANKLYVCYHRQFELRDAERTLLMWRENGRALGLEIVPTIVLEDYDTTGGYFGRNFADSDLRTFSRWCKASVNGQEFGIYDVTGDRQSPGSVSDAMMNVITSQIGNILTRVGLQPGEALNSHCSRGVEDDWTAECQGNTNSYYSNPVYYNGTNIYGRLLLQEWVNARVNGDSRIFAWDLIPIAWNYNPNPPPDPYGYTCPGDSVLDSPPLAGRLSLCQSDIAACYPGGGGNSKFGGYSCDMTILGNYSYARGESPDFYSQIRSGQAYTGYWTSGINQAAAVFQSYNP